MQYRPEIDGLRAIAVVSVILYHAQITILGYHPFKGGFVGVDIFFVISGFLISCYIFENLEKGNFSFFDFFARRIRRIFPALILVMTSTLVLGFFVLFKNEYTQLSKHIAYGAAFINNFILADEIGYFDNAAETKPMLHLWSLAVEEQFYIVWPFVLWLAYKKNFNLLYVAILFAVTSFYINLLFINSYPKKFFYLPFGRFWELMIGCSLAWLSFYKPKPINKLKVIIDNFLIKTFHFKVLKTDTSIVSNLMLLTGLFLLVYGLFWLNTDLPFPSKWAIIPVLGTALIIASGSKTYLNHILLSNPILVWIGLISYPLYLWHWPIFSFMHIMGLVSENSEPKLFAIILSFILAWLTYKFVEKPIRNYGKWHIKTLFLLVLISVVGAISFVNYKTKGNFLPKSVKQSIADTAVYSPMRKDCHFKLRNDFDWSNFCKYYEGKTPIAVFGNSHSVELAYGIALELKSLGLGIQHHTMSGCNHNVGLNGLTEKQKICSDWQTQVIERLKLDESIYSVIVSYRNENKLNDSLHLMALVNMLDSLIKANKEVILVLQAPLLKMHINDYIRKHFLFPRSNVIGLAKKDWLNIYHEKKTLLEKIPKEVKVYDPSDLFCDDSNCYAIKNGKALYFDTDHMSVDGAKILAKDVVKLLSLY